MEIINVALNNTIYFYFYLLPGGAIVSFELRFILTSQRPATQGPLEKLRLKAGDGHVINVPQLFHCSGKNITTYVVIFKLEQYILSFPGLTMTSCRSTSRASVIRNVESTQSDLEAVVGNLQIFVAYTFLLYLLVI